MGNTEKVIREEIERNKYLQIQYRKSTKNKEKYFPYNKWVYEPHRCHEERDTQREGKGEMEGGSEKERNRQRLSIIANVISIITNQRNINKITWRIYLFK